MKLGRKRPVAALALALTFTAASLAGIDRGYVEAKTPKTTLASSLPPLPQPQWPFPCAPTGACTPHWFSLVSAATLTADSPLVLTVSGSFPGAEGAFPYGQPPAENGVIPPAVTVGISGSGLTLQPRSSSSYTDTQMWYAIAASSGDSNPSYLISSLPPLINPVFVPGTDASPSTSLALGYIGNTNLPSPTAGISNISFTQTAAAIGGGTPFYYNTYATVDTAGSNSFLTGQIVDVSGNSNPAYNGVHVVEGVGSSSFTINVPYQYGVPSSVPNGSGGTATAMAAVYLLQQNSQHLDTTYGNAFQQWSYDASDRTICNQQSVCLYSVDTAPVAGSVVSAGPKPATVTANYQWYFYPDRTLSLILQRDPIPFPTIKAKQESAAEQYIAKKLGLSGGCNYNGVAYYGLRCQYSNLAAPLPTYLSLLSTMKAPPSTKVSVKNWRLIKAQLILELTDAIAVQNLFNQVENIYATVFLGSENLVNQDLADLAADLTDQTAVKRFSWQSLVEGLVYTGLNFVGALVGDPEAGTQAEKARKAAGIALGVTANLMETGVDTALAENPGTKDPLANMFEDTAAKLYSYFFNEFTVLGEYINGEEQDILQDWGKLGLIGILAQQQPSAINGMNGAYWDPTVNSTLVQAFTDSYQLAIMEQLLPQYFDLYLAVDWVGGKHSINGQDGSYANQINGGTKNYVSSSLATPTALPTPAPGQVTPMLLDQYATPEDAQGSTQGLWHTGWLYLTDGPGKGSKLVTNYLTPQLAQDVQNANPYLLYNGLGSWAGQNASNSSILANVDCSGTFTTITNFTPRELRVAVASSNYAGGGYGNNYGSGNTDTNISDFSSVTDSGVNSVVDRTLPPYGVLQYAAAGSSQNVTIGIWDFAINPDDTIAFFNVVLSGSKNSCGTTSINSKTTAAGYVLTNDYETGTQVLQQRAPLVGIAGGN
ncbi:MAG TPA: hypothetical protein VMH37_03850 [Candidatus Binataceae bacterium]|nr:hypothetical protein [Candidatus Binataceae bacterium]